MRFDATRPTAGLMLAALTALCTTAPPAAQAQDGRALLQKALQTYRSLGSYEGASNVDSAVRDAKGRALQSTSLSTKMSYKAPNRLALRLSSPEGSKEIFSDGTTLTVFEPSSNAFSRVPTAPDMAKMAPLLARQAQVAGVLDPLDFLGRAALPRELGSFKAKSATLSGRPVWLVSSVMKAPVRGRDAKGKIVTQTVTTQWSWWIDKETNLLRRIEASVPGMFRVPVRQGDKMQMRALPAMRVLRHTIVEAKPNANPADSVFAFRTPKGAVERGGRP